MTKDFNFKNIVDEIKRNNSIIDVARNLGLELHKIGGEYRSYSVFKPGDNDNCTAFYANDNRFYDFKEGRGGDVIDLVAELKYNGDKGRAINELYGKNIVGNGEYIKALNDLQEKIKYWHSQLRPCDRDYLHKRGLTNEYIDEMLIGYSKNQDRLMIPYFENGKVIYHCGRDATGRSVKELKAAKVAKYKKAELNGFNKNIIWGLHSLGRTDKPLVVAEGAFDAMSFDICGYRVLSSITGASNFDIKLITEYAKQETKQERDIYITFDNDDAGQGFFTKLAKQLIGKKLYNFKRLNLPVEYKDISEFYAAGGSLDELIENAISGVNAFIETFKIDKTLNEAQKDKKYQEFRDFVIHYGRFMGKAELSKIFRMIDEKNYFDSGWLDIVLKEATSAPLEHVIITEIQKKHEIIFKQKAGFYEYNGAIWRELDECVLNDYIGDELGDFYKNGSRINSTIRVFEGMAGNIEPFNHEEFNKKPLLVFSNGTLEIETGKFRAHDKHDMSTILLNYPYDKDAKCPKWEKFLREVTWRPDIQDMDADGEARIKVLQEFAGYILLPDCRMHKALFLAGEGSNGKSVFLSTIKGTLCDENISNIEVDRLDKPFQAVGLLGKLANFTTEAGLSFKGAEAIFKKVVSGETITDSYKGRDNFNFKPRAKFIIAGNDLPRSKDKSYGFNRRFMFVRFNNKFVEGREPNAKNGERAMNKTLDTELLQEKAGIFNWLYEGYKRLIANGGFSKSPDNDKLMAEFISLNNPLIDFVNDNDCKFRSGAFTRKELYKDYKDWCDETSHKPMACSRNFWTEFRKTGEKQGIAIDETRLGNDRAFRFSSKYYEFKE